MFWIPAFAEVVLTAYTARHTLKPGSLFPPQTIPSEATRTGLCGGRAEHDFDNIHRPSTIPHPVVPQSQQQTYNNVPVRTVNNAWLSVNNWFCALYNCCFHRVLNYSAGGEGFCLRPWRVAVIHLSFPPTHRGVGERPGVAGTTDITVCTM